MFKWLFLFIQFNFIFALGANPRLMALKSRLDCIAHSTPGACQRLTALTSARPYFLVHRLGAHEGGNIQLAQADPAYVRRYQEVFRALDSRRASLLREFREFNEAYFTALKEKSDREGQLRPYGGASHPPTLSNYFHLVRDELRNKIPDNIFMRALDKQRNQFKIAATINTELLKVGIDHFPLNKEKILRPALGVAGELTYSQALASMARIKSSIFPTLKIVQYGETEGLPRHDLTREVRDYRKFRRDFAKLDPDATFGMRNKINGHYRLVTAAAVSALWSTLGNAAQIGLNTKMITDCSQQFGIPLDRDETLELVSISFTKGGLKEDLNCRQLGFEPDRLQALIENEKKMTPRLQEFLEKYDALLAASQDPLQISAFANGFDWGCDGTMSFGNSKAVVTRSALQMLSSNKVQIQIPIDSVERWDFKRIQSSDPSLAMHLESKFRNPFISITAAKDQLQPLWACDARQFQSNEKQQTLCELSYYMQAWNQIANVCAMVDDWESLLREESAEVDDGGAVPN